MTTMNISIPESVKAFVQKEAARRGYADPGEFVASVLEAERLRDLREEIETSLERAAAEPSIEMTDEAWEELDRDAMRLLVERKEKKGR